MALKKYKLGDLLEENTKKNEKLKYGATSVRGVTNNKQIAPTKATIDESVLHKFYIVEPMEFIYNPRTTRNGEKISIALNDSDETLLFTFNDVSFRIKESAKDIILPHYLYLFTCRSEFDRYVRINSWGSATELFSFAEMCDIDIELPSIEIQQKYVNVYKAMVANQKAYEKGLDDLKLVCDAYIENIGDRKEIGNALQEVVVKNTKGEITKEKGVSVSKKFIDTKASASDITTQKIVNVNEFAFNSNTSRNSDTLSIALNNDAPYIVSNTYVVCKTDENILLPQYLFLWFCRKEFDRYARFNSWGSARETISLKELQEYKISIPSLEIQTAIANIYNVYFVRREINEKLKAQIKDLCPILIAGAIKEAKKEV